MNQAQPAQAPLLSSVPLCVLGLVLFSVVAYAPVLFAREFIWDDWLILTNPLIRQADGLLAFWLHPLQNAAEEHYWPLTYSIFWLQFRFWGSDPFGYHLVNILLHAANVLLFWHLLRRLTIPGAFIAAAIFAVHPVHIESVAWIVELKDVLSGALCLGALCLFFRSRSSAHVFDALVLFALALLTKSVAVVVPVVILFICAWRDDGLKRRHFEDVLPFVLLAVLYLALDAVVLHGAAKSSFVLPLRERILLAGRAFWFYAAHLVFPYRLLPIYPKWNLQIGGFAYLWPLATIAAVTAAILMWRRFPGCCAAVLIYVVCLLPTLGLIAFSYMQFSYVADRYQYLASAAPIALLGAGLSRLRTRRHGVGVALAAGVIAVLFVLTLAWSGRYRDTQSLFGYAVRYAPDSALVHSMLGIDHARNERLRDAAAELTRTIELDPADVSSRYSLAVVLWRSGRGQEAMMRLDETLQRSPDHSNALALSGVILKTQGHREEAAQRLRHALRINPGNGTARQALDELTTQSAAR